MDKIELKTHKPKAPRMTSFEETIQIARINQPTTTTSALYERKHNQKALKVLTVAAYILFVSMAAITLSFYYVFIWDPSSKPLPAKSSSTTCGDTRISIPESLAIRLANSTEISAEKFYSRIIQAYKQQHKQDTLIIIKSIPAIKSEAQKQLPNDIIDSSDFRLNDNGNVNERYTTKTILSENIQSSTQSNQSTINDNNYYSSTLKAIENRLGIDDEDSIDDTDTYADFDGSGSKINLNETTFLLDDDNTKNAINEV